MRSSKVRSNSVGNGAKSGSAPQYEDYEYLYVFCSPIYHKEHKEGMIRIFRSSRLSHAERV